MASHSNDTSISTTSETMVPYHTTRDDDDVNHHNRRQWYPDMFDILDQFDEYQTNLDEKQRWAHIEEEFNTAYHFDHRQASMLEEEDETSFLTAIANTTGSGEATVTGNDDEMEDDDDSDEMGAVQVLSQRLSQLSTTAAHEYEEEPSMVDGKRRRQSSLPTTTAASTTKKPRTNQAGPTDDQEALPDYLSSKNRSFERMLTKAMAYSGARGDADSLPLDQLRKVAFFLHQISAYTILHQLWSAYLQAGIGLLKTASSDVAGEKAAAGAVTVVSTETKEAEQSSVRNVDRRYWPNPVKSLMEKQRQALPTKMTADDEQRACEEVVRAQLRDYDDKAAHYQRRFDEMKRQLSTHWSMGLEQALENFVRRCGTVSLRMKCDLRLTLLIHQYTDEILQRQYAQQQNPTVSQTQLAQRLYDLELRLESAQCDLLVHRQRVICNQPPVHLDALQIPLPSSLTTIANSFLRRQLIHRYEQLIQQTKTDLMAISIAGLQAKVYQLQSQFNAETDQMWQTFHQHHRDTEANQAVPKSLISLIHQRSINLKQKAKVTGNFIVNYHLRSSDGRRDVLKSKGQESKALIQRLGFLPRLIVDTHMDLHLSSSSSPLSKTQRRLLDRGPTYVPPGQLHVSPLFRTTDEMLVKQYAPLKHQLAIVFEKYHIDISRSSNFQKHTYAAFKELYSTPLPQNVYQRALYEKKLVQSIRAVFKQHDLLLRRTADHHNRFYLGPRYEFIRVCVQYMAATDQYRVLHHLSGTNDAQQEVQQLLNQRFLQMNTELERLCKQKRFNTLVLKKLQVKLQSWKLPYLYFLPDVSTSHSLSVQPMMVTYRSPTSKLAQFLAQLLRPFVARYLSRTTMTNEADFLDKLLHHAEKERHLHPTTLFATITMTNFHTMHSHPSMVTLLVDCLTDHLATNKLQYSSIQTMNQLQWISIDTIKQLTELYLENSVFYYEGKIYGFAKGMPDRSLFSELLSTICLAAYEKLLFHDPRLRTEFCGRCQNQLFFTWNRSPEELKALLESFASQHRHVHMQTSMGRSVHFLSGHVENRHGQLYTCVHPDTHVPRYTLPYVVGHAKVQHARWFRWALLRAVRLCSNYVDFQQEQTYLEMTCLANGYSIEFVETQMQHFYLRFNAEAIRFSLNQTVYERLRRRALDLVPTQRSLLEKEQELEDQDHLFRFSYPCDYGSHEQFNRTFHQIWSTYLKDDPQLAHKNTKTILDTKHIYSLHTLLGHEKPFDEL